MSTTKMGDVIEFMDANGVMFRGTVTAFVGDAPVATVLGYPTAFPLTPITPQQASFALGQSIGLHLPAAATQETRC